MATFKNKGFVVTDTEEELLAAGVLTIVHSLYISNSSNGTIAYVTVKFVDSSDSDKEYVLINNAPIKPGSSLIFDKPINLEINDSLRIVGSDNDLLNSFLSIMEM